MNRFILWSILLWYYLSKVGIYEKEGVIIEISVYQQIFQGIEESWRIYLRFEDVCWRLENMDPVFAFSRFLAVVIRNWPILTTQHLHTYLFILFQCPPISFLPIIRVSIKPFVGLFALTHTLNFDPLFLAKEVEQLELHFRYFFKRWKVHIISDLHVHELPMRWILWITEIVRLEEYPRHETFRHSAIAHIYSWL